MINLTPITTYHAIPIYVKQHRKNKGSWLQWVYDDVQYGVPITTMNESLSKAKQMIDAMLALEGMGESA